MKLNFQKVLIISNVILFSLVIVLSIVLICRKCSKSSQQVTFTSDSDNLPDLRETEYLEDIILGKRGSLYGISLENYSYEENEIERGETFSKLMNQRYNVNISKVNRLIELCKGKFDLRDLRAGNNYTAFFSNASDTTNLEYLVYNKNRTEYITFSVGDSLYVKSTKRDIQVEECYSEGVITSSLSDAVTSQGLSPALIQAMADIYQYTINFHMLQKGDKFKILYQEMFIDTTRIGIGKVYGVIFTHKDKEYTAIRFKQGDDYFWNEKGENMRKSFLRAPLAFKARRSSKFGMRVHPIYRTRKMHNGVDYAAPKGTPVMSIAEGRVLRRYWDTKGGGNTVWIKHSNGLESGYLHLSKFASSTVVGARVARGQIIGYVGSTGHSTGAHLDFRVKQNGRYINPENLPMIPTTPIQKSNKVPFEHMRDEVLAVMAEYANSK